MAVKDSFRNRGKGSRKWPIEPVSHDVTVAILLDFSTLENVLFDPYCLGTGHQYGRRENAQFCGEINSVLDLRATGVLVTNMKLYNNGNETRRFGLTQLHGRKKSES